MKDPRPPPPQIRPDDVGLGVLFTLARDAVVVGDAASGCIVLWNDVAAKLFGYTAEEATNMPIETLVPPSLRAQHHAGLARYVSTGAGPVIDSPTPVELPALRKDGSEVWVELTLSPLSGPDTGNYVMALLRDVTERKHAHDQLETKNRELEAANQTIRDFAAALAHDVRGPLSVIMGASDLLLAQFESLAEDQRQNLLNLSLRQAGRLNALAEELLAVSRIETGEIQVLSEPVLLGNAVEDALEQLGSEAQHVRSRVGPEVAVIVDPSHLQRMVTNCLSNALKYGAPPVLVDDEADNGWVRVGIKDHGPGVPSDLVPRLFEKFARHPLAGQLGFGLGLSIVRGLARANGGDAWYEPGQAGAHFVLRLPRAS